MTTAELVERFIELCIAQNEALLDDRLARFSQLFGQMRLVLEELKARPGDHRSALLALYDHPNMQGPAQGCEKYAGHTGGGS